ncbi:toxin-antitoxin system TumE family protein [Thiothrix subterranea]|uniref:toxin-antitoxin system TumE family protein n=1 Tax=Thiothrix subterranea TaxID=2735563 RepID=UPI00192C107B|nr:DUF6516 family protein [Thiothrix subterranea]
MLTAIASVVIFSNMSATEIFQRRIVLSANSFAELVAWELSSPVRGSLHHYKYRLAFVVDGTCVVRYDNEAGKGDHKHLGEQEVACTFTSIDQLVSDFYTDVMRWRDEHSHT